LTSARGTTSFAWVVARRNVPKRNIFEQKNPENADNMPDRLQGAKSGWPSSCNAFAIARFLVLVLAFVLEGCVLDNGNNKDDNDNTGLICRVREVREL